MNDDTEPRPLRATRLFVQFKRSDLAEGEGAWPDGADGIVLDGETVDAFPDGVSADRGRCILCDIDPERAAGRCDPSATSWVVAGVLDVVMRRRDAWPELDWVPRIEIYRPETRFDFHRAPPGEGFSMYMPDTSAIQGFCVADTEGQPLESWLRRALTEGFRSIWLHGRDAAQAGTGADIGMLERARRHFAGGRIWLSGGIADPQHLKTLAREGGAKAAVVPASLASRWGCAVLAAALELDPPADHPIAIDARSSGRSPLGDPA